MDQLETAALHLEAGKHRGELVTQRAWIGAGEHEQNGGGVQQAEESTCRTIFRAQHHTIRVDLVRRVVVPSCGWANRSQSMVVAR